jgi:phage baseplate assembly protein W
MPSIYTPFRIDGSGRVAKTNTPERIVEQQIIDVLTTSKFERVMRPTYGAGATQLLYEPVDDLIYGEFKTDALMELNKHLTMASISNMLIQPSDNPYVDEDPSVVIEIKVQYSMAMSSNRVFSFKIATPNGLTEESLI